jgi:hypothetical protein
MVFRFHQGIVQQDNYLGYAVSLPSGLKDISFYDSRLFPGLPAIIYFLNLVFNNTLLCGYLAVFLAFIGSYVILYKLTGSANSFIPLMFPPVMLSQSSLVATEIPVVFLILLSLYLFKKEKYSLAVFVSAFGFWIRAIAIIPGVIILSWLLIRDGRNAIKYLSYFLFPLTLLVFFNLHFFGAEELFHQFTAYQQLGLGTLGITQIFADIPRAYRWGWYRIFASGVFYFSLAIVFVASSIAALRRRSGGFYKVLSATLMVSMAFIFSLNSVPFLENLGRYLAPTVPVFWLLYYDKFRSEKLAWFLLSVSLIGTLI